jgi:hypothetical protein
MATEATASEYDLTAIADSIMLIQNGHFLPQNDMYLKYAYAGGLLLNKARIVTPSFRQLSTPYIRPTNLALLPLTNTPVADYSDKPLKLRALEEVQVNGLNSANTSGVYTAILGMGLMQKEPIPQGDIYTIRGTGTTTAVVNTWTQAAITWQDTLPNGQYVCVGLNAIGATARAGRLIFQNQTWRPGSVANALVSDLPWYGFRNGNLGVWGAFAGNAMPNFEIICGAADTAQEIYMDFIRIG